MSPFRSFEQASAGPLLPGLGAHSEAVLQEKLGLGAAQLAALRGQGVLG